MLPSLLRLFCFIYRLVPSGGISLPLWYIGGIYHYVLAKEFNAILCLCGGIAIAIRAMN